MTDCFTNRYTWGMIGDNRLDLRASDVQNIIDLNNIASVDRVKSQGPGHQYTKKKTQKTRSRTRPGPTKVCVGKHPETLVKELVIALNNETAERNFSWLSLHRSCSGLFKAIEEASANTDTGRRWMKQFESEPKYPVVRFLALTTVSEVK